MNQIIGLDLARSNEVLQTLAQQCRENMRQHWPQVNFDGDSWPIYTLYDTKMLDVGFGAAIIDFAGTDASYLLAFRCLMARAALEGKAKSPRLALLAWRLLHRQTVPLGALHRHHICDLEEDEVKKTNPAAAHPVLSSLKLLGGMLDDLARLGVISYLGWGPSAVAKETLRNMSIAWRKQRRGNKDIEVLDRQIEGLSDATQAMLLCDERLSAPDRSAIAVANILMCAPSRINEPLCMRVSDRYKIEDYAKRPNGDEVGPLFQAHQLLLMKGSKGADWSGKPILNFMIGLSEICWNTILQLGQRSRTLLEHYEQDPNRLYLLPELEYLRGTLISKNSLWKITNLTNREPSRTEISGTGSGVWATFTNLHKGDVTAVVLIENPRSHRSDGEKNRNVKIQVLKWQAIELYLLERVRERMEAMRRVTRQNRYYGVLSEMLMLVDTNRTPYLPQAWDADAIRARLKTAPWRQKKGCEVSVFIKLDLQMTKDGELVDCQIEPHDTRRWLTTKALDAQERLSDVLINKWANRINVTQLAAYDLRTAEQKANQAALPVPKELQSITAGLQALEGIENEYGLHTEIVVAHGDGLAVTSVDAVTQATENRPVARSGNQIIILYPNRFGICLHQHHETPCRAYAGCSEGCNEQLTVKGHLPTNEEWRRQEVLNNRSIVNQLQALITARQRGLADDPATLDAHLLTLIKGVNMRTMADELIERFHEIKVQIHDLHFRNELEAAFVSHGVVTRLDDPAVPNGALIKYHNPSKHAAPGHERALEAQCGGRKEMQRQDTLFYQEHPELAPRTLGLNDERHLLEVDDDNDEEGKDEQAA
ncbi:hypothetical protein [Janthinobacterium sp. LB3P118]|uniref:hypothetical protein n=1 Tax=Janthinobacterium sp. LB3P118 TaxID=3424195 RepID=UPI003F23E0A1